MKYLKILIYLIVLIGIFFAGYYKGWTDYAKQVPELERRCIIEIWTF